MPFITSEFEGDLTYLVIEKLQGVPPGREQKREQTGIKGTPVEVAEALLSIVDPSGNHLVHEEAIEHIQDLKDLLTEKGAEMYGVRKEQFSAFEQLVRFRIYMYVYQMKNLTEEEQKAYVQEKKSIIDAQSANREILQEQRITFNPIQQIQPPNFLNSLAGRFFSAFCVLVIGLVVSGMIGFAFISNNAPLGLGVLFGGMCLGGTLGLCVAPAVNCFRALSSARTQSNDPLIEDEANDDNEEESLINSSRQDRNRGNSTDLLRSLGGQVSNHHEMTGREEDLIEALSPTYSNQTGAQEEIEIVIEEEDEQSAPTNSVHV